MPMAADTYLQAIVDSLAQPCAGDESGNTESFASRAGITPQRASYRNRRASWPTAEDVTMEMQNCDYIPPPDMPSSIM